MSTFGEILIGTYEDFIVGYQILKIKKKKSKDHNESESFSLEQSFAVRCHSGSVKCLATNENGSLAVSGGVDEMVNLISLAKRKLLHSIEVAANCVAFARNSHIIFGSQDGNIYIYEYKNSSLNLAKILGGHKGPVTSLSVHPSGKILLSLSEDRSMRTWNLIKGRPAYTTNLRIQAHIVRWSPAGDVFVIVESKDIYYFDLSGNLKHKFSSDKRINSVDFLNSRTLLVASDSGFLEFINLEENISLMRHEAHTTRIKSVRIIDDSENGVEEVNYKKPIKFVTSSSDGIIKLWSLKWTDTQSIEKLEELANSESGARITCMTLATGSIGTN